MFNNFINSLSTDVLPNKIDLFINYVTLGVYNHIREYNNVLKTLEENDILKTLEELYVKPKNEIFTHHILTTYKQQP